MGGMAVGPLLSGSTHDPPYEQMVVRVGAGASSMFYVGGEHCVSDVAPMGLQFTLRSGHVRWPVPFS